ncbi:MAG: tetratricopeptide repeat protein [Acidobacteriota bacterium]|nr:tetratricopeptide repeat protein [Acidobacteriota bacterium]
MKPLLLIFLAFSLTPGYSQENETDRAPKALLTEIKQLMHHGHYERAQELLRNGPRNDPFILRLLLELAQRQGRDDEVNDYAHSLLDLYASEQLIDSDEIVQAAYGAWKLGQFQNSNQIFIAAGKTKPTTVSMFIDWGHLYLTKYNAAEAEAIFRDAIMVEYPSLAYTRWDMDAAYVGLAQALDAQFKTGADEALNKALELNPENLEARVLKAQRALKKTRWQEAKKWLEEGLEINPNYLPLLEVKGSSQFLQGKDSAFEKTRSKILKINPNNGDFFEMLGDFSVFQRHFDQAIDFFRQALKHNPRQASARASLGINLLRMGHEEEGAKILEVAYTQDPFNIWTVNTLRLLDSFDHFVRVETPNLQIKLHESEADVLKPYAEELAQRSLKTLQDKYNHQISDKYIFEMYPDHADFAVRTLGLPGLGALGATFGRIVAMDSPSARPKGEFHWGSTLWHEMAHVVTLSLSNDRVPRWLTEGISMMEERQAGAGWGEPLTVGFVKAYEQNALLPLADLNLGFEQPKNRQQLTLSYFQAGWVCEFLFRRYGLEKIRSMLVAFGQETTAEKVFQKVLQSSIEEVDEQFHKELSATLTPLIKRLSQLPSMPLRNIPMEGPQNTGEDSMYNLESLEKSWQINPDNYFLNLQLGSMLKALGRPQEALLYLETALDLFPAHADRSSPYALLSAIYEELSQKDNAIEMRRRWWQARPLYVENAYKLSSLLIETNQHQEAAQYLEEVMYLDPFHSETHERLGEIYLESGQFKKAIREFEVFLSLSPIDIATAHYKMAQAFSQLGNVESSRKHVLLSLEIAPGHEEAQELLLKLVRK